MAATFAGSVVCVVVLVFGCLNHRIDAEIADLTHVVEKGNFHWPGYDPVNVHTFVFIKIDDDNWVMADNISMGTHVGTHMDAPTHFWRHGWTLDKIPLERLIGPGVIIDVRAKVEADHDYGVSEQDVKDWEAKYGPVPEGAIVFMCSGWSDYWGDAVKYYGSPDRENSSSFHFPSFTLEAAKYLVEKRNVYGLGADVLSVDRAVATGFPVHHYTLAKNLFAIENAKDTCKVPPAGATIEVMPIKIAGASGGPTRVIAHWDTEPGQGHRLKPAAALVALVAIMIASMF